MSKIDVENAKTLREAFDWLSVKVITDGQTIFDFDRDDIISCNLDLRSVDTDLAKPELQVSTIEVKAYWDGSESDFLDILGRDTEIQYQTGYTTDKTTVRKFYTTLTSENITIDRHVLTIKGVDKTSFIEGQDEGHFIHIPSTPTALIVEYSQTIMADIRAIAYSTLDWPATASPWSRELFMESKSRRKNIANWMNMLRGDIEANRTDAVPRFIYRDAGIPYAYLGAGHEYGYMDRPSALTGTSVWEIDYSDTADLTITYGNAIKAVTIDNPDIQTGTQYMPEYTVEPKSTLMVKFDDDNPTYFRGQQGSSYTISVLSPWVLAIHNPGNTTITAKPYLEPILKVYSDTETPPCLTVNSGLSFGDTVELEAFNGLKYSGNVQIIETIIERALTDCNLRNPKWIEFTWRGDPRMQPRDFILLTEKDGTKNYYEIDNLTLDHENGGMTSKIKAIYKCSYAEVNA